MQNKNPLVSIVLNCYNGEKFLKQAVDSVLDQTYKNWELVFWDNQSTDNSADIIKAYQDERIKYFYAPYHTSLGAARNYAIEKTNGEFISFLDCDDLYYKEKLAETIACFEDDAVGLVYTNGNIISENNEVQRKFYFEKQTAGKVFDQWLCSYQVMIPSVMIRKNVLSNLKYIFDERFSMIEEFDLFIRIAKDYRVEYCKEITCAWRIHSNSLTWSKREMFEKENKIFLEKIKNKDFGSINLYAIKKFEAKIAYHEFYNLWKASKKPKRNIIKPYILIDKRLIVVYIFSFFSIGIFEKFLKAINKSI